MILFSIFGALALALAGLGCFGVASQSVVQRRRELALRLALGAKASDVKRLVVGDTVQATALGLGAGLIVIGFLAGEVSDAMRDREPWAFLVGIGLSVLAVIGSVMAFEVLAPDLVNPSAIRWGSVTVFGGAGIAAAAGLFLLVTRRDADA